MGKIVDFNLMITWFDGLMVHMPAIKPFSHLATKSVIGNLLLLFFAFVVMGTLLSCEQRDELAVQALIKKQVASNVELFRNRRIQICYQEAMEEALYIADSIAIANAIASKDTSQFIRPSKPAKPTVIIPKEGAPIAPLFREEGLKKRRE